MFFLFGAILIFYYFSCGNAINFQIDGRIDLGKKWTYEYKVIIPETMETTVQVLKQGPIREIPTTNSGSQEIDYDVITEAYHASRQKLINHDTNKKTIVEEEIKTAQSRENVFNIPELLHENKKNKMSKVKKKKRTRSKNISKYQVKTTKRHKSRTHNVRDRSNESKIKKVENKRHVSSRPKKKPKHTTKKHKATTENEFDKLVTQFGNILRMNVNTSSHKIKYDAQINSFTEKILKSGLEVIKNMKNKTTDQVIINKLDMLAASYENQYKKFLKETSQHDIKTRLGTQKVILNAIDVSDRILKRLVNYFAHELDQKNNHPLRQHLEIANSLQHEVFKLSIKELKKACKTFGVCRSGGGFSEFLNEYLSIILNCDNAKFKQAIDSLTEVTKNMDFSQAFKKETIQNLVHFIRRIEGFSERTLKPGLMIIKNIIANKNKPIVLPKSEISNSGVNSTLALHEIIDLFDIKLPRNDLNILKWGDLRSSLKDWADNKRFDVQEIMESFMNHIKTALEEMPSWVQDNVAVNLERAIKRY